MSQSKMKRGENGISLRGPIKLSADIWYYENKTNIEVYVSEDFVRGSPANGVNFKIARRKLEASLRRMNAARRG